MARPENVPSKQKNGGSYLDVHEGQEEHPTADLLANHGADLFDFGDGDSLVVWCLWSFLSGCTCADKTDTQRADVISTANGTPKRCASAINEADRLTVKKFHNQTSPPPKKNKKQKPIRPSVPSFYLVSVSQAGEHKSSGGLNNSVKLGKTR